MGAKLDKLTGTRHELSFQDRDPHDVYIGKEFTKDVMIDRSDELLDGPENWMNLLTLQEQFEMLTQAGYDVELTEYRCVAETEWLVEYGDIVDPSSIDLTLATFRRKSEAAGSLESARNSR